MIVQLSAGFFPLQRTGAGGSRAGPRRQLLRLRRGARVVVEPEPRHSRRHAARVAVVQRRRRLQLQILPLCVCDSGSFCNKTWQLYRETTLAGSTL